jgi:hypothetical protein
MFLPKSGTKLSPKTFIKNNARSTFCVAIFFVSNRYFNAKIVIFAGKSGYNEWFI